MVTDCGSRCFPGFRDAGPSVGDRGVLRAVCAPRGPCRVNSGGGYLSVFRCVRYPGAACGVAAQVRCGPDGGLTRVVRPQMHDRDGWEGDNESGIGGGLPPLPYASRAAFDRDDYRGRDFWGLV
ncbi:hypothetical protein GCM10020218_003940 [Dactylosporangium vinaceum]